MILRIAGWRRPIWGVHRRNVAQAFGFLANVKTFGAECVAEVLRRIYDARIPGRIEWMFDDGFVWVLLGGSSASKIHPRLWVDDVIDGERTVAQSKTAARIRERSRSLVRDWLKRGREQSIEAAVCALAEAIVQYYPKSEFVRWWREDRRISTI